MNELKNYPWSSHFPISEKDLEKWKQSSTKKSLTFYALKKGFLKEKDYFNWALDYYQIPKVDNIYFQQSLMKKADWNQIQDTYDWTEEVLPVSFWNDTIFIGCVEMNDKVPQKIVGFDIRVVLTSQKNLTISWSFLKTLSDIIEKTATGYNQTAPGLKTADKGLKTADKGLSLSAKKPALEPSLKLDSEKDFKDEKLKGIFEPDLPSQKKIDPKNYPGPILSGLPQEENLRQDDSMADFPERSRPQEEENQLLFMKKKNKKSAFEKNKELLVDSESGFSQLGLNDLKEKKESDLPLVKNSMPLRKNHFKANPSLKAKKLRSDKIQELKLQNEEENPTKNHHIPLGQKTKTGFSILTAEQINYQTLWDYTKKHYCSSMIFNVEEDKAYLKSFTGRVKVQSRDKFCVDFNDYTFFKVVQRGYPYNGFIVESPGNQKFFAGLGWDTYPQYTTALPIKDHSEKIDKIFVGFSLKNFSKQEIQNIQKDILDIIQKGKVSQAA